MDHGMVKYYILSLIDNHASAVISETEKDITFVALKHIKSFNAFTNNAQDLICVDDNYSPFVRSKNELSAVFDDVEVTKDYWRVFEYFTGKKHKAVANNTEN